MIKINLLPQHRRVRISNTHKDVSLFLLGLILLGAFIFGADYYFSTQKHDLEVLVQERTQTKALLQKQVEKVDAVQKELEQLKGRVEIIKAVRLRQGLPVRYIDEVASNVPQERMWLESFTLGADGKISLTGVALDNQVFASYVEDLRSSVYIGSVDTQRTSRQSIDGLDLVFFQCSVVAREYFENLDINGTTNG
jgi:type IV pilus assembly protein PilN